MLLLHKAHAYQLAFMITRAPRDLHTPKSHFTFEHNYAHLLAFCYAVIGRTDPSECLLIFLAHGQGNINLAPHPRVC